MTTGLERPDQAPASRPGQVQALGLTLLGAAEDAIYALVAAVLLAIAGAVLYRTTADLLTTSQLFPAGVTDATNELLFVIIIMEILRTVVAHFRGGGFQLKPFLIIGIISAVRHVLSVGARLSLATETAPPRVRLALLELGVNAAVVLALVVALVLVRRTEVETSPPTLVTGEA